MSHYETLGVAPESGPGEVRRAYLAAARDHHPDFHAGADDAVRARSARRMQELNEAWEVLSDPARRADYDRSLRVSTDPGVARRAAREPGMPEGKGWTPRQGDDAWMTDFDEWANEEDDLEPDRPPTATQGLITVAPVGLFALAILSIFVGLVVKSDGLVAIGAVCIIFSLGLFLLLPMFAMSRGRRR